MENTLEELAGRVAFLEMWLNIPAVHLPGYAPSENASPEVAQAEPEQESTNAEGTSQSEQLPVLDGEAQ